MATHVSDCKRRAGIAWRNGAVYASTRAIAEETAVALTFNGSTHAVLMATPRDLADFAIGFSLTERIIKAPDEIDALDVVETDAGVDVRIWLAPKRGHEFVARRRAIAGPTGCGLCGIESLEAAGRSPPVVKSNTMFRAGDLCAAMKSLAPLQRLNRETRAMHAAAFWQTETGISLIREDVGRHNAVDKLVGALARRRTDASQGVVLLTSRVSVEMIQKLAEINIPALVAISAPTTLAIDTAQHACVTLIAIAREDGFEIFTHAHRIKFYEPAEPGLDTGRLKRRAAVPA